jgi:hypothetical protein
MVEREIAIMQNVPYHVIGPADAILYVLLLRRREHRVIIVLLETSEGNSSVGKYNKCLTME